MAMKNRTNDTSNKMQEMRRPCPLYGTTSRRRPLHTLCQIGSRQENEFRLGMNVRFFPESTVNGLSQRLNQSDSMEELVTLLRRFTVRWEQLECWS